MIWKTSLKCFSEYSKRCEGLARRLQVLQGVFKGVQNVAIKVIHKIYSPDLRADIIKEVAIMGACRHPHVIQVSRWLGWERAHAICRVKKYQHQQRRGIW